jgi:hypothetical protein
VAIFCLGTLPWLLTHHAVNWAVGETLGPANKVVEYNLWPGTPFSPHEYTGGWNHTPGHFVLYAAGMLLGRRGFLGHNLPLLLAVPLAVYLLRRKDRFGPELAFGLAWCSGAWLLYSALSTNWSGACCSVRWFVPFLAPGYFALARGLERFGALRLDFLVLAGWGVVLGAVGWLQGPWAFRANPFYWPIVAAALLSWRAVRWWARRRAERDGAVLEGGARAA